MCRFQRICGFAVSSALLILLAVCVSAAENLDKEWFLNNWKGYKPAPAFEKTSNGLHVSNVTAKYGMGMRARTQLPVKAGDLIRFKAVVKGKGKFFFQPQFFDKDGKWLGVAPKSAKVDLTADWQEIALTVRAENIKDKITSRASAGTGVDQGGEFFLKNTRMEVDVSEFDGDYAFPRHWSVFAPVSPDLQAPLETIPAELGGVKPKLLPLDNNLIRFNPFFPEKKLRNTAWLYAKMEADTEGSYTIGAGADYFMAVYVNGKCVLDTLKSGDVSDTAHFTNHKVNVKIRKGSNIFAIKFQSGLGQNPRISLGGAEHLRNLASTVVVTETFHKDDYETPGKRSGNPELFQGILTDGIEVKTMQAVYKKGSVLTVPGRKYSFPAPQSGKLFATGLRLYRFNGTGELLFSIGRELTLSVGRSDNRQTLTMSVKQNGKILKSGTLPEKALPSDIIFAADAKGFCVNAQSLQDSRLRCFAGEWNSVVRDPFVSSVKVNAPSVTVDEYFTGTAKREIKSSTVPFKIALDAEFDPVKAGWKLIWQDEFDGKEVDWEKTWMNSPWAPVPRNRDLAYLKDGLLHIVAEFKADPANGGKISGRTVALYSQKRFRYGYYEARVRFTKRPGWWAAFWMLDEGRNMSVAGGYEIDIFEDYATRGGKNTIANNLHVNFGPGNRSYGYHFPVPGSLEDFHTVGCKWTPFELSVYLDGKLIRSSSRHSPYQSVTYDAMNHGFCTSSLYLCVSGQCKKSGPSMKTAGREEYLVDYVRAYEYPHNEDPAVRFVRTPEKSCVRLGEKLTFEAEAVPSAITKSPIRNIYLFDNGNLIAFRSGNKAKFDFAIDKQHYGDTIWTSSGRSSATVVFDPYPHLFTIAAQDEKGKVAATAVFPVITDMLLSRPYNGRMPVVPGKINTGNFDEGGNYAGTYKQKRRGGSFKAGEEGLFSRKKLNLREGCEWANFSFRAEKAGNYAITLKRSEYRRFWPMRALVLIDGVYAGDFLARENAESATLKKIGLPAGDHRLTLISACAYGVWPEELDFIRLTE